MNRQGLKILVLTSSFPRHERDLSGHFVRHWCTSLASRGHSIDVLCWRGPGAVDRIVASDVSLSFVPYAPPRLEGLFFGAGAPENLSNRPVASLLAVPAMAAMFNAAYRRLRGGDYDAVVGHWLVPSGLIARAVGTMAELPSFVVAHSGGIHLLNRLPRPLGRLLAAAVTAGPTTVPTAALRRKLVGLMGRNSRQLAVAPMGFSPGSTGVSRTAQRRCRIGFLGRFVPIKGLPTVFDAIENLRKEGRELELNAVGQGPCETSWRSQAPEGVRFSPPLFGAEKWHFLDDCDALVLPSLPRSRGRHEGLPVSLLEGASAGAVPLVSGVPGVEDWLANPSDQIVEAGDSRDWYRTLRWFCELGDDELTRLRRRTRRVVDPLAWPTYSKWWERWLYCTGDSTVNRRATPRDRRAHRESASRNTASVPRDFPTRRSCRGSDD